MSHRRLAANTITEGTDLDSAQYTDEYRCDGCQVQSRPEDLMRLQGQAFKYGASAGYINADLCDNCLKTRPVAEIVQGM